MEERGWPQEIILRSEELNRTILDSLNDHIAILDRGGTIIAVNELWQRFARDSGASSLTAIGPGINYLSICRQSIRGPDELSNMALSGVESVLEGKKEIFLLEYPCPSPSESRWFLMKVVPLKRPEGGAVISHTDITQRKKAEEALRDSEERFRAIFLGTGVGIALVGFDGHPLECNPALQSMLGYSADELRAMAFWDFTHPDDIDMDVHLFREMIEGKRDFYQIEKRFIRKSGEIMWGRLTASLLKGLKDGRVLGVGVVEDISQRKKAEEALRKSERALRQSETDLRALAGRLISAQEEERGRLARELHDDLTQQLAALAIHVGKLEQQLTDGPEAIREKLHEMKTQLVKISEDVHGISRQLHPSILEDLGLVDAIKTEANSFSRREGVVVHYEPNRISSRIPKDVALVLYRVVQEGLRNIAKHARATEVHISLKARGDTIQLFIRDNGIGLNWDQAKGKGGLGLASMEERVRLIHGKIIFKSKLGEGTLIEVKVPLALC